MGFRQIWRAPFEVVFVLCFVTAPPRYRQARLMSQALRKLTAVLNNTNCTLIFINQIRQKVRLA